MSKRQCWGPVIRRGQLSGLLLTVLDATHLGRPDGAVGGCGDLDGLDDGAESEGDESSREVHCECFTRSE